MPKLKAAPVLNVNDFQCFLNAFARDVREGLRT